MSGQGAMAATALRLCCGGGSPLVLLGTLQCALAAGCTHGSAAVAEPTPLAPPTPLAAGADPEDRPGAALPSDQAAQTLTREGRAALERGEAEHALTLLERAVALRPDDGEACYWLAEAWSQRGDAEQARTYHGLAARFLAADPSWRDRLAAQRARLGVAEPQP